MLLLIVSFTDLFHTYTYHATPRLQPNWWSRSTTFCRCFNGKSSIIPSSTLPFICSPIHTDTHYAEPSTQSNQWSRSTISGQCSQTKQSNVLVRVLRRFSCLLNLTRSSPTKSDPNVSLSRTESDFRVLIFFLLLAIPWFTHWFIQTLTKLNLEFNRIGNPGVRYLANALQENQVTFLPRPSFHSTTYSLFHTDTSHTLSPI